MLLTLLRFCTAVNFHWRTATPCCCCFLLYLLLLWVTSSTPSLLLLPRLSHCGHELQHLHCQLCLWITHTQQQQRQQQRSMAMTPIGRCFCGC
jgi:hypothetical protein